MGRARVLALILVGGGAVGCAPLTRGAAGIENAIVFQPKPFPKGDWNPAPRTEDVWIDSSDGVRLHGWLAEPARGPSRAVVLYTHGNGGNVTNRRHVIELFRDRMNATVLVFDYRGYGRSDGRPTENGVLDDARAARRWLAARAGVREADVVLAGHSLGGGVAVDLAARDGARGLILEGTFTNLPDVAASHVPLLPVRAVMRAQLDSVAKIGAYRGPLLQVHGDADRIVPYALGRRLFEAANEPKQFVTIPGGNHNEHYTPEYVAALDHFITSLP
ncbi:alpha/beta hydrolase [Gemmata sp. JC673]|uniref:Alpha/beta hydrolase n=1 Tax=Gemmata algarum TaxID=2975278 RepID=A0ABU5EYV8_9BACT|nr:alpha/beta hydrolase [Gemmata algarum]MDY3558824.1 alpha/beta hydrolase [Gemmata algarum]